MVRASLPAAGVAAVLLVASAAVGQTPVPYSEYSSPFLLPVAAEVMWEEPAETPPPLELVQDGLVLSFDAAAPQDSTRLKPTPQKGAQTKESPAKDCPDGDCATEWEEFPSFCCLPFAAPYPQQQGCSGHKCHRRQKGRGHHHNNNNNAGCGNPYLAWPFGPAGCPGFCAPPPQQNCGGRRCHCNKGGGHHGGCNSGGYGYGGYGGYAGAWGGCGCDFGYCNYLPPPQQNCGCRKCQRKHHGHQNCPRCGYPNGGGYGNAWAFPVPGWSTENDGYNSFTDPNCMGGGCKHSLFRRCHGHKQQAPPCPYGPMPQPCFWEGDSSY